MAFNDKIKHQNKHPTSNSIGFIVLIIVLPLLIQCKKENAICILNQKLDNQNHLVDLSPLNEAPELLEKLNKFPNLQVRRIINDEFAIGFHSNVFHKGIIVLTENYIDVKSKKFNFIHTMGIPAFDTIPISLTPTIQAKTAIKIARSQLDKYRLCLFYRLGIIDINSGTSFVEKDFKLTWEIQGEEGWPNVVIDAHTGEILSLEN